MIIKKVKDRMSTNNKSIHQIINSLMELEVKGCHSTFFEYGNGMFRARIFSAEKIVYERTIILTEEQAEIEKLSDLIDKLKLLVCITPFQCYRQEFVKGVKSGKWEIVRPLFVVGENATQSILIDGSGYYINDPDNDLLYFVDYKNISEMQ